jgi:hypothetical protein
MAKRRRDERIASAHEAFKRQLLATAFNALPLTSKLPSAEILYDASSVEGQSLAVIA